MLLTSSSKVNERLENGPQHIILCSKCVVGVYPLIKGNTFTNNINDDITLGTKLKL